MQRRVYHVRARDLGGQMMHKGGATVLLEREDGQNWLASVCICSPLDRFCKRIGLNIVETRMRSHHEGKCVRNVVKTQWTDPRRAVIEAIHAIAAHYQRGDQSQELREYIVAYVLAPLREKMPALVTA